MASRVIDSMVFDDGRVHTVPAVIEGSRGERLCDGRNFCECFLQRCTEPDITGGDAKELAAAGAA